MTSTTLHKAIKAPPWAVSLLSPLIARSIAAQLVRDHADWNRQQVETQLRADLGHEPDVAELRLFAQVLERWPADREVRRADDGPLVSKAIGWLSPSVWVLVAANLIPLYGVFALGWTVFPLLLLFWFENVVIGLLNAARMLCVDPSDAASWIGKIFMVPFFCVHYGIFTAAHGALLMAFFGGARVGSLQGRPSWLPVEAAMQMVADFHLGWQVVAIGLSHAFSFLWNYIGRGEFRRSSISQLMSAPYGRIIVLHFVILLGGFAAQALQSPVWALVLLVTLKIAFDLNAHIKERRRMAATEAHSGVPVVR